jgi:hypothetical protein
MSIKNSSDYTILFRYEIRAFMIIFAVNVLIIL